MTRIRYFEQASKFLRDSVLESIQAKTMQTLAAQAAQESGDHYSYSAKALGCLPTLH